MPLPKKVPLPSREQGLFKELLALYETRQLKKAIKTADTILKKFPEHGETLAMKGLVLTHMPPAPSTPGQTQQSRKEEGLELIKRGVRLDLTSHIVWHVLGLVQKADKAYEDALKSYHQALRFDNGNMNLLKDSAQIQTHLRMYEALVETRSTILRLRPTFRGNWVALAVALVLAERWEEARKVIEHYLSTLKNVPDYDTEHSETLLFYIAILSSPAIADYTAALSILDNASRSRAIVDRTAILEARSKISTSLASASSPPSVEALAAAEEAWRALIQHNPECHDYYHGFLSVKALEQGETDIPSHFIAFSVQQPTARTPKRLLLTYTPVSPEFEEAVRKYLYQGLTKGIPSLFSDLKSLYTDEEKRLIIQKIAEDLLQSFSAGQEKAEPSAYLWTLYFLAQHHSHPIPNSRSQPDYNKALQLITLAIEHTPTLPDLHLLHARILKRAGDLYGAARAANEARMLDQQDRFLNTKCGKYFVRSGAITEGEGIWGLFTKKDAVSPAADLEDMQSLLFLLEEAESFRKSGRLNMALKRYLGVKKVFDEIDEDQFDFHGYNLRKFTLNIYLKMQSWETSIRTHPSYVHAAMQAAKIYLALADDSKLTSTLASREKEATSRQNGTGQSDDKTSGGAGLSAAEKKARKKAKKAAAMAASASQKTPNLDGRDKNADKDKDKEEEEPAQKTDDDPDGMKLVGSGVDGLEEARKLWASIPLERVLAEWKDKSDEKIIETLVVGYDIAIRRHKLLQATRLLSLAVSSVSQTESSKDTIQIDHPSIHTRLVDFFIRLSDLPQSPPPPISPVLSQALSQIVSKVSLARHIPSSSSSSDSETPSITLPLQKDETLLGLEAFNNEYLQRNGRYPGRVLSGGAQAAKLLGAEAEVLVRIVRGLLEGAHAYGYGQPTDNQDAAILDVQTTWRALAFLESIGADEQVLDGFRQKASEVFPLSTVFAKRSKEEEDKIRKGLLIPSWGAVEDAEEGGKEENQ